MVYKIVGDFNNFEAFQNSIKELSDKFLILYYNNTLYIGVKNFVDVENSKNKIKHILDNFFEYFCQEINKDNISQLPQVVQDWAIKIFTDIQKEEFELKEQEKLSNMMKFLDNVEIELKKLCDRNEGRVD